MFKTERGFSMIELLAAVFIMGVLAAMTVPYAIHAVKDYRLHTDAMALSSYLNVVRMRAASQYAPYRLVLQDPAFGGTGTYGMEKLCGFIPSTGTIAGTYDANCTSAYQPFTNRKFEVGELGSTMGAQYLQQGNTISFCRPTGITSYPLSTITADPGVCSSSGSSCPNVSCQYIYFNTRGLPVDLSGNILSNGGNVFYIQGPSESSGNTQVLTDAVTVSVGGRVSTWYWSWVTKTWSLR